MNSNKLHAVFGPLHYGHLPPVFLSLGGGGEWPVGHLAQVGSLRQRIM